MGGPPPPLKLQEVAPSGRHRDGISPAHRCWLLRDLQEDGMDEGRGWGGAGEEVWLGGVEVGGEGGQKREGGKRGRDAGMKGRREGNSKQTKGWHVNCIKTCIAIVVSC